MPVYQEKNKSKLPKNGYSWYFRVYYTDIYGNRKQKQSKMFPSKTLAKDNEREFLNKINTCNETDNNINFEIIYNEWLEFKKTQIKITTHYSIKKKSDKHILKWFKPFKLHSIKTDTLKKWREEFLAKKYSPDYQNIIIGYLQEILEYAVNNYDFDKKVATKLQKQRVDNVKDKTNDAETNYWTYEEFKKFIRNVTNDLDKLMYNFLYFTGLRLGEMIALTWKDIDLEKKKLKIYKTFTNKIEGQTFAILDPKTSNSVRTIDLDDELIEMLKEHKLNEEKIVNFDKDMFIFGNVKYIAPTTFANHLNKNITTAILRGNLIKRITPHGFRHSHASLLIFLGRDSRDVADRLGDTVQTIEKTYAHLFPEKRKETIDVLNNFKKGTLAL